MKKIYVLAGKARTGKDSVAKMMKDSYSVETVLTYSCTMYLKKYIKQIYGWDGKEETKPRGILQSLGREIKKQYPNFFIDRMEEDIKFLSNYCDIIIVTGVRLEKELAFLKEKFDAVLIKTEKSLVDNNLTEEQKNDITETDVDNYISYDYIINNDNGLKELKKQVKNIMEVER